MGQYISNMLPTVYMLYLCALQLMHDVELYDILGDPLTIATNQGKLIASCLMVIIVPIVVFLILIFIMGLLVESYNYLSKWWEESSAALGELVGILMICILSIIAFVFLKVPHLARNYILQPIWRWLSPSYS